MKIVDHIDKYGYGTVRLPKLEGRVRVVLKDKKTGRIEKEVRGHNVITDAVKDIFANNYLGSIQISSLLPLYQNWYGGILGYKEAHTDDTDPTDYFIKGNGVQELMGFAGNVNPTTAQLAEDKRRGRKIAETLSSDGKIYSQTFEWGSEEGNGVWSAVSLCHKDLGNVGTGSTSSSFQAFTPFANIGSLANVDSRIATKSGDVVTQYGNNILAQYDDLHCLYFHHGEHNDYYTIGQSESSHINFSSTKITVYKKRLPMFKAGLADNLSVNANYDERFTIDTPITFISSPAFYFDYTNKYLWLFTNVTGYSDYWQSNSITYSQTIKYCVIDCENETLVDLGSGVYYKEIENDAPTTKPFAPIGYGVNIVNNATSKRFVFNIIKDGNIVYFPTTNGIVNNTRAYYFGRMNCTGYKKVNLSNNDQTDIDIQNGTTLDYFTSPVGIGGLIICDGLVVNNDKAYKCSTMFGINDNNYNYTSASMLNPNKASTPAFILGNTYGDSGARYILANKMIQTSKYNLKDSQQQPTSFTKDNTKLLQITYTLTETAS